jgi:hypothetical protein
LNPVKNFNDSFRGYSLRVSRKEPEAFLQTAAMKTIPQPEIESQVLPETYTLADIHDICEYPQPLLTLDNLEDYERNINLQELYPNKSGIQASSITAVFLQVSSSNFAGSISRDSRK